MRYKITVEYFGKNYCGWQNQKNGDTVQETLEKAFSKLLGQSVSVTGSGRTDAGVHALGQVAHFDASTSIPADKIPFAVNTFLPEDIRVKKCEVVPDDFNARFWAKRKTYLYKLYISPHSSPIDGGFAAHIAEKLDLEAMRAAAKHIEGEHDFKGFSATGSVVKSTVRTVYSCKVSNRQNRIEIEVCGNGFLYNMVRIIAGTLVAVGTGKIKSEELPDIIASGDRRRAGKTLSPQGLYLKSVEYEG